METRQRAVKSIAERDKVQITELWHQLDHLMDIFLATEEQMRSFSHLATRYEAINLVTEPIVDVSCVSRLVMHLPSDVGLLDVMVHSFLIFFLRRER